MVITQETIFHSEQQDTSNFKLYRLSRAYQAAMLDKKYQQVFVQMIGVFPRSPSNTFANALKGRYVGEMREARDYLVSRGVWKNMIDGYLPLTEAPSKEFYFTVTVYDAVRTNPFAGNDSMSMDDVLKRGASPASGDDDDDDDGPKYVVDPFSGSQTVKATLEVKLFGGSNPLSAPGEFTATLEMQGNTVKEVGSEWTMVKRRLVDRMLGGRITKVEFNISIAGKLDLTDASAKKLFGTWGSEAKTSIEFEVHSKDGGKLFKVEFGAKIDNDRKGAPVLEISF